MKIRTSATHPLEIATVITPVGSRIGLTFCPGKKDLHAMTGPWDRDLRADLAEVSRWGASILVTLMEEHELLHLNVAELGATARSMGLAWLHLPIRDASIPCASFERHWEDAGAKLRARLAADEAVVIHCRGGLGRTGLVAARLLIELGERPERALARVRKARNGAVETPAQEAYVLRGFPRD